MKYIITGATGFLGNVLIRDLLKNDLKPITVIVRNENQVKLFDDFDVEVAVGSLNNDLFLRDIINEGDVFFHLAGVVEISKRNIDLMYETNVNATKLIADICNEKKVSKFIYVSSVSAIDPLTKDEFIKEPKRFDENKVIGDYAKTKSISSEYIYNLSNNGNLNGVIIYPSLIIGPYDYRISSIGNVILKYLKRRYALYIKGKYNMIDVRDVSDIIISAYFKGNKGESFLATNKTISLDEMFKILNKIVGKKKLHIKLPLFVVKPFLPIINIYYNLFNKIPVFTNTSIKILNQNSNFDNSKTIKELNYTPRELETSFKDMIDFFEKHFL